MQKPEVLYSEDQIRARIQAMGADIGEAYAAQRGAKLFHARVFVQKVQLHREVPRARSRSASKAIAPQ
jgi:hypoxanthine-guanine phosphoribosyltransferase